MSKMTDCNTPLSEIFRLNSYVTSTFQTCTSPLISLGLCRQPQIYKNPTSIRNICVPTADPGDKEYPTEGSSYVVWAIGRLNHNKDPMFHDIYPKGNVKLELNRKERESNCFAFTHNQESFRY